MNDPKITAPWVDGLTMGEVLSRTAREHGNEDAVVFPSAGVRWSWSRLDQEVTNAAAFLRSHGVLPGEHVGIWSMNCVEWVVAQFAVARMGAVLVNVNPAYRLHELEEALRLADVSALIVGLPFKFSNFVAMVEAICPEVPNSENAGWISQRLPKLRRLIAIGAPRRHGWISWSTGDERQSHVHNLNPGNVKATDIVNIQFTSGTTGLPKGAMLTHRNILMNAFYIGQRVRYTSKDRVCVPVPFYHCFGCVLGTAVCAVYGSAIVVPAPSFDPKATLQAIADEKCTSIYGVPTMFVSQLDCPDFASFNLSSLRTGIMAGSPCPLPLMKAVVEQMGASQITIGYGLTEASPIITQTHADDPMEVRVGTVGSPIPGVDVKLLHPVTREEVKPGETGELCVKGHGVMAGYYNAPETTAKVISPDGWLATGDLARRREDGNYRIVGRSKELIIRGGENIYPPEIEEFLHHHPSIAEVAVVGLPDRIYGEVVSAWVVAKTGTALDAEAIREFCRGQIAHFKVPHYVEIIEHLPKTVTGKIQKHVLRSQGIALHKLEASAETPMA